jgi:voltage-gated potassium channel
MRPSTRTNPNIANYADALYFTVTALTTTGFGDITLPGTAGRLITIVIMIFGVTLFLNLARVLFSPSKVRFDCPDCGLQRHDVMRCTVRPAENCSIFRMKV